MIKIEKVELSPNPVVVNGKVKISVTIVTHNYLNKNYTHKQLATYTHKQLKDRGTLEKDQEWSYFYAKIKFSLRKGK